MYETGRICEDPGPYDTHCTLLQFHRFSCYDACADVSFNYRQDFEHSCDRENCPDFVNEGD